MRINQFVAQASGLSRRAADTAIVEGRVTLDSQVAVIGQAVNSGTAVTLDGTVLTLAPAYTYLKLHKPAGYVSSRARQSDKPTLYELLPAEYQSLRIAGRLDLDSSGLIILSSDGNFIQTLSHPTAGKTKRYELILESPVAAPDLDRLARGVMLTDGLSQVTVLDHQSKFITVTLEEGRNRQLRRTFGALGYTVVRLHRTMVGELSLGDLPSGHYAQLDAREVSL